MKTLSHLFNVMNRKHRSPNQVSPDLFALLTKPIALSKDNYYAEICAILLIMDATSKLGWVEHTSDWDLGATIETRDKQTIHVLQGYADSLTLHGVDKKPLDLHYNFYPNEKTKDFYLRLTPENCDGDDDVEPFDIKISNIKVITFYS